MKGGGGGGGKDGSRKGTAALALDVGNAALGNGHDSPDLGNSYGVDGLPQRNEIVALGIHQRLLRRGSRKSYAIPGKSEATTLPLCGTPEDRIVCPCESVKWRVATP